ncbi:hypothetical protein [Nonomuraea basaltis]|uniref:hypothetical protein n=1 Tax=Nonomuraea basaltis TaxID=2495887 RepID=UPI00110C53D2|nr:hypothetical protein [Nonomuraea basaltis]TMR93223.1 hypothetical protein EJK15_40420 [Nonomuraea basaltis]
MTEWQRDYAMLALRINRLAGGAMLIYRGPEEWSAQAGSEPPAAPGKLADDAERLLDGAPSAYLAGQVRAMRAVARHLNGERLPLAEYARECLGLEPRRLPETVFEEAHAELDAALPKGPGPLAERLQAWQAAHTLDPIDRLPGLVAKAVAETRARTNAIIPLPDGEVVGCRLVEGVSFHGAGDYEGGLRSTIHINKAVPFNLADLLYLVSHEGHPGHIAESMLKEIHLADRQDQGVRFMLSPAFVLSEGLGLLAEEILFPGDEAQTWLNQHIFPEAGIRPGGHSDFAAIHHAKNVLWGVWGNVAFLAAEGRTDAELAAYLARWSLYSDDEVALALGLLKPSPMSPYIFGYFHGWELLRPWAARSPDRVRRLLTEQLLPADVTV